MELELADCQNGKFKNFYKLGKDFGYFGDFIYVQFSNFGDHEYNYFESETYKHDGMVEFYAYVFTEMKKTL